MKPNVCIFQYLPVVLEIAAFPSLVHRIFPLQVVMRADILIAYKIVGLFWKILRFPIYLRYYATENVMSNPSANLAGCND